MHSEDVIFSEIDGETILMDGDLEHYYGMEPVSTEIWKLMNAEISFDGLISQLVKIYEISAEQCKEDITPFLQKLYDRKMIVVAE
ncbi:PqqD family protein [Parasphingorhabdus sp.]